MKRDIRDNIGRLIGTISERAGRYEARDAGGRLKGTYDPRRDETRDAVGRLLSRGDTLSRLF
jgi:hypothetical protein